MRGADLTYNGIGIALTKTNQITINPVMTDDGMDFLYMEVTIDLNGIINSGETAYAEVDGSTVLTPGTLPSYTYEAVRQLLSRPRGQLKFNNYLNAMFASPGTVFTTDANGGPFPQSLRILRIDGAQVFHINYSIKFYISDCFDETKGVDPSSALLSVRFSQSESINHQFLRTLTTSGTAYFRVDVLSNTKAVADTFRSSIVPPVVPGFARQSVTFRVDSKRNVIVYDVQDVELMYEIGDTGEDGDASFITRVDGSFRQSTIAFEAGHVATPNGNQMAVCNVKLWGSKRANTWNMTQAAFAIIGSNFFRFGDKDFGVVKDVSFYKSIVERYVEVTVSMMIPPSKDGPFGLFQTDSLKVPQIFPVGQFNGVNPSPGSDNGTRADAQAFLLLESKLTDACNSPAVASCYRLNPQGYSGGANSGGATYCGPPPEVVVESVDTAEASTNKVKVSPPYPRAIISSEYKTQYGTMQLPYSASVASTSGAGGGGGSTGATSTSAYGSASNSSTPPPDSSKLPQTCTIITLTNPMTTRRVTWEAERVGTPPQIPALISNDSNQILVSTNINPLNVVIAYDGETPIYSVSGVYVYAFMSDMTNLPSLPYDVPQWVDWPYGTDVISLAESDGDLIHGLSDPTDQTDQLA